LAYRRGASEIASIRYRRIYSHTVNTRCPLAETLENAFPWCAEWEAELKRLFRAYVEAKQRENVLDYDDLLLYWADMMEEPALARLVGERFDHILVDEYSRPFCSERATMATSSKLSSRGEGSRSSNTVA